MVPAAHFSGSVSVSYVRWPIFACSVGEVIWFSVFGPNGIKTSVTLFIKICAMKTLF